MKRLTVILFILLGITAFGQGGWRITGRQVRTLSNGIEVMLLQDTTQKDLYLSVYCSYRPVTSAYYAGMDRVFAQVTGGRILMDSVYAKTLIVSPEGLDSALRFLRYVVFEQELELGRVRQAMAMLRQGQEGLYERAARLINYPRDYALGRHVSEYLQASDVAMLRYRFSTDRTTLVLAGNLPDSAFYLLDSVFGSVKFQPHEFSPVKLRRLSPRGLYFVNVQDSSLAVGFVSGFRLPEATDMVRYRFLQYLLEEAYPQGQGVVRFSALGSYMAFFIPAQNLNKSLSDWRLRLANPLYELSGSTLRRAADRMVRWLDSTVATPWGFEDMIYLIHKSGKEIKYLSDLRQNFAKLTADKGKTMLPSGLADNYTPVIVGNELLVGCQILDLSARYDINFTDSKIYRYKVIRKGFNAWTVINRYIRFVSPQGKVKNLSYRFEADFFVDSTFIHLIGFVWKKYPNLYRYQTFVITDSDTLVHHVQIFDGNRWIDSSYFGRNELDSVRAGIAMKKAYILGELYYKQLGYEPQIVCEPDLLAANIYKIRVRAGSVYFDELYDIATGTKISTKVSGGQCWQKSFYYYDYRRVQKGNIDFKIPFTVVEQAPQYALVQTVDRVSFAPVSKRVFSADYYFWPGKRARRGVLFYISRGFDKIKKLCIF